MKKVRQQKFSLIISGNSFSLPEVKQLVTGFTTDWDSVLSSNYELLERPQKKNYVGWQNKKVLCLPSLSSTLKYYNFEQLLSASTCLCLWQPSPISSPQSTTVLEPTTWAGYSLGLKQPWWIPKGKKFSKEEWGLQEQERLGEWNCSSWIAERRETRDLGASTWEKS